MTAAEGRLSAVGVGPGDPGLITLRTAERIRAAHVVAYHCGTGRSSVARGIAEAAGLIGEVIEEELHFPVTTGAVNREGGYYTLIDEFYDASVARLAAHLKAGRDVVVLCEGDPLFYGSFMYLHDRLLGDFDIEVVAGVTSVAAASSAVVQGIARHEDVLTVLPGTLPVSELARRLADTDAAVVMKLGRTFTGVRDALHQAGLLDRAVYIERASSERERVLDVKDVEDATVPYMSIVIVPGHDRRADVVGRHISTASQGTQRSGSSGRVSVIGLGPAGGQWLTPEASARLAEVDHVVGYAPYVDRVPQRAGLQRYASGNTVEVERASHALRLAADGEQVAVVSGGDAGVFGMAAAVFEASGNERFLDVDIEVLPGVTAAHAVAARAGAPLSVDYATISLSDRLKPWHVVENRLRHVARADLAIAIYNARSHSRPDQLARARNVLCEIKSGDTVVVIGRNVGRDDESLKVTTLSDFNPETVDMSCLLIVGASSTRVTDSGRVWTPRVGLFGSRAAAIEV